MQRAAIATVQSSDVADPLRGALFAASLADQLIDRGEIDRADGLLREAMPLIARFRSDARPLFEGSMAYITISRGQLDQTARQLELSLAYHQEPPHRLPLTLAERLIQVADLASKRVDPVRATRLLAAADMLIDRGGTTRGSVSSGPIEPDRLERDLRAALGEPDFSTQTAIGSRLSIPAMIALALEVVRSRTNPPATSQGVSTRYDLTPRERDVFALLITGKSNATIADELFISERTVTTHLSRLYAKLDVRSRSEAIALANQQGLFGLSAT